ncbi:MAG: sigma-70 family RNA polymerase sigma factor [Clostridiales bacterium]|nr:sigma-70 family RNA polymerase sigma factor [Clostridiales bacterium]
MDDSKIVDLYLARDEMAIKHSADKYGRMLRSLSYRITENQETSEECENDTYLEAWNLIPPNEPRDYLSSFLSRIVRNISLNRCIHDSRLKRKGYITELTTELEQCLPDGGRTEQEAESKELAGLISDFLRKQPKEKRIIFMRRYFEMEKVSSIAQRYGYSENRINTMLFRMRNDLKKELREEGLI